MRCKQKNHQTSRFLWKCQCSSGFQHGRSCLETSLRPPIDLPQTSRLTSPTSGCMKRNNFVVGHMRLHKIYNSGYPKREIMGGVTGGLWEMQGRSYLETSRLETPVNTGVSKENGRSWHKSQHILKTSDCRPQQHFLGNFDFVEGTSVLASLWQQALRDYENSQLKFGILLTYSYLCNEIARTRLHLGNSSELDCTRFAPFLHRDSEKSHP